MSQCKRRKILQCDITAGRFYYQLGKLILDIHFLYKERLFNSKLYIDKDPDIFDIGAIDIYGTNKKIDDKVDR